MLDAEALQGTVRTEEGTLLQRLLSRTAQHQKLLGICQRLRHCHLGFRVFPILGTPFRLWSVIEIVADMESLCSVE